MSFRTANPLRLALLAPLLLVGCGGSSEPVRTNVEPFTAAHEPLFENGVDMVRDPEGLDGAWLRTWEDELDRRVTMADVVALVTIRTLRTDVDLDRRETFRLVAHPERVYLGEEQLADEDLLLSVAEGEGGYGTVANNERRLLDAQFIAFVKWKRDADTDELVPRWHLSPATEPVATRVRALLERRRDVVPEDGTRRRVIIHRN